MALGQVVSSLVARSTRAEFAADPPPSGVHRAWAYQCVCCHPAESASRLARMHEASGSVSLAHSGSQPVMKA